ncbi:MAG: DUF2057 family protein [Kiritimatiellia bacterium]|nr:DUF2057 family protein [Kiritimatiellia bacterium]MDP6848804.1 DUF2057 family protein [Kiritimatiellia bacterium]
MSGRCLIGLLLVCACAGCASPKIQQVYAGPRLPITAVARLRVPSTMVLMDVDGQSIGERAFASRSATYELRPGTRRCLVRYEDTWPMDEAESEKVISDPVMVNVELKAGQEYYFAHDSPVFLAVARRMAKNFRPELRQKEIFSSTAPPAGHIATAPDTRAEHAAASSMAESAPPEPEAEIISPLEMLLYWWDKASPEERKFFIKKVER